MRRTEKQRMESIIKAANRAEDKLYLAKKLIDDAVALIETAFLLHDQRLYDTIKPMRKVKEGKKVRLIDKEDDDDEVD